jgi:hypothetical protein
MPEDLFAFTENGFTLLTFSLPKRRFALVAGIVIIPLCLF